MSLLQEFNIFEVKILAKNLHIKGSAYIEDESGQQIVCLVCENDELIFRSAFKGEEPPNVIIKIVNWFRDAKKSIQDVCFDPSGLYLLVLCYDNTLHTIPLQWILYQTIGSEDLQLSRDRITSFIVPFAGPHECPNSKTCPNNNIDSNNTPSPSDQVLDISEENFSTHDMAELNEFYISCFDDINKNNPQESNNDKPLQRNEIDDRTSCQLGVDLSTNPCPYPTCVIWWKTLDGVNHAIIGYSDGSICIVGIRRNCPLIASTTIESGGAQKFFICTDLNMKCVTLMINSTLKEQWKLLLEQKSINYVYPGEMCFKSKSTYQQSTSINTLKRRSTESMKENEEGWVSVPLDDITEKPTTKSSSAPSKLDDWQIVIPMEKSNEDENVVPLFPVAPNNSTEELNQDQQEPSTDCAIGGQQISGILPAARARLQSLRDLGAKKIGALKLKLSESKLKTADKEKQKDLITTFAIMDEPATNPEILTTSAGPIFMTQCIKNTPLLSALHINSDTLSVHTMNISIIPIHIYKIPLKCSDIIVTPNFIYTLQTEITKTDENVKEKISNRVGIVSCKTTTLQIGEDSEFNKSSLLNLFEFNDEYVINMHRVSWPDIKPTRNSDAAQKFVESTTEKSNLSTQKYVENREMFEKSDEFDNNVEKLMQSEFPSVEVDKCFIITNKSMYSIELRDSPHVIFLSMARKDQWNLCEEFCQIFNLNFSNCVEYVGDVLLKEKETALSLLAYNLARIPRVKTALKLAMYGENGALMNLCAMALKIFSILKSKYPINQYVDYLRNTSEYEKSLEYVQKKKELKFSPSKFRNELLSGVKCSDFSYNKDEIANNLHLSNSSQFHLSNLLLLTLAERTIKEKHFFPLWNFLVVNKRYHTKMTSIVLCQSGLYYSALLLSCARGAHLDAFCGLVGVSSQEFGWYSELNNILTNISDEMFMECILYLPSVSIDYFTVIQSKIDKIDGKVLEKLKIQLDPFSPIYRPVVSQLSAITNESTSDDTDNESIDFSKFLIETFLIVLMKLYMQKCSKDNFMNALNSIYVSHEVDQFAIKVKNCPPLAAGFSHCACIIDGAVYLWGSNGVNCALSSNLAQDSSDAYSSPKRLEFLANLGLEVHAVKCGSSHTLILTNNGLYSMGLNNLGQLGLNEYTALALQPMLIRELDGKNIVMIDAGQYHNAVVADDCLYTWGWGLHGQLGHGSVENFFKPKLVSFFVNKKILQISLGHAHTLVLCQKNNNQYDTILYVFGSNHFGQLGVGYNPQHINYHQDVFYCNFLKSLSPIELDLGKNIRLIQTKFFTNLAVTQTNELYVWGASSQALRLQNQARKRSKANQKRDEMAKEKLTNVSEKHISVDDNNIKENDTNTHNISDSALSSGIKSKSMNDLNTIGQTSTGTNTNESQKSEEEDDGLEEENTDHLYPSLVDTGDVVGNIMEVSTGLYHFAIITDKCHLYTWGKNFEKQIGRDNARNEYELPTLLETIENALYVECGADFTLVMTMDYVVKAFGSNSLGQCGREITEKSNSASKLVMLRISKRVVRIPDSSQCYEIPLNVNLPRPKIKMDFDPVKYLKGLPTFRRHFINKNYLYDSLRPSNATTVESNLADLIEKDTTDIRTSLDNLHINECNQNVMDSFGSDDDQLDIMHKFIAQACCSSISDNTEESTYLNDFIHYCLFIFHGIYNPTKLIEYSNQKEFKVRILMLNYRITEAFSHCISGTKTEDEAIAIFEYFTKDVNIIPIHREDLKYLIYELFMHFINNKFTIDKVEQFFMNDFDYYLLALAYVLYFSNNNTELERQVSQKYSHLFEGEVVYPNTLLNSELIFQTVSTLFKTRICQKLLNFDNNFN